MKCSACCTTRSKWLSRFCIRMILLPLAAGLGTCYCFAQDVSAVKAKIVRIAELNSLDGPGMKPWHLRITYLTLDGTGQPGEGGSIEEWWAAPDRWRQEF